MFMKKRKNKKGFSLVELLAVVVILGLIAAIGIGVTSNLVEKSKREKMESQKNTVTLSAQTYMQNNKNLVPKIIGESRIIKISDLRLSNYLTEDIKNNEGESCMEKSYVKVYKLSNSEYTYTTFLYCGSEEVPEDEVVPLPLVSAKFSDSSGTIKDANLNNVSDAYLYIEINAASEDEILSYKNSGTEIALDGYSFSLFVVRDGKKQEAYNSGSLSGGREQKIVINKKLDDYIDVTNITQVSIEVTAINTLGGITNINTTVGEHGEVDITDYEDNIKPKCVKPENPYGENDWLNKNEYNTTKLQRKLTVGCNDGTGSGCIRNYFTMSWPNDDDKYGAEYVFIEVKDNAGNISEHNDECKFRVNVDIQTPEATVTAHVGKNSTSNTSSALASKFNTTNVLTKAINVNDKKTSASIESADYDHLIANNTNIQWMNAENYPDGVVYKIVLKDNIRLDKWTWHTNAGFINDSKSSNYLEVSANGPEASSGTIAQDAAHGATEFHGSTSDTVYVRFLTEGMRYGVFTVYDKSGNSVKVKIAANLDRTAPPVPNSLVAYVYNKVRTGGTSVSSTGYSFATWTNRYVQVQTAAGQNHDKLSHNTSLSGFWEFRYYAQNNAGTRVGSGNYSTYTSGKGVYDFKGSASQVDGKNKIKFMGCDKAGNCSDWGTQKQVWIDITFPGCSVEKVLNGTESTSGWLGAGETAVVRATCSDATSGCTKASLANLYNSQIITTMAGAVDNGIGGSFTDYAGNTVDCPANQTVKIDYSYPTCSVSGGSSSWTNASRTVIGRCRDTGGSGCAVSQISHIYNYDIKTTSGGAAGDNKGGSVKDKADNETSCPANQTVKVDRTDPYHTISLDPGDYYNNNGIRVVVYCHDDLSGLADKVANDPNVWNSRSPEGGWRVADCCEDNAGNVKCENFLYDVYHYSRHKVCGVEEYNSCATAGCGVSSYNTCANKACGSYCKTCTVYPCFSGFNVRTCKEVEGQNWVAGKGCCAKSGTRKTSCSECGSAYNSCATSGCGVKSYKTCPDPACGVKLYKECWHL